MRTRISGVIKALEAIQEEYGDLLVATMDDRLPSLHVSGVGIEVVKVSECIDCEDLDQSQSAALIT